MCVRALRRMNPSQKVCVHLSYFLELNNLAGKQVLGLKGFWGRQCRFVNVTLKTREIEVNQA